MKIVLCWIKAIPLWIKTGHFVPHIFEVVSKEPAIIIAGKDYFRVSETYEHEVGEEVIRNALLEKSKCTCCGKEEVCWYDLDRSF